MRRDLLMKAEALQRLDMPWWAHTTLWAQDPELARVSELIEMGDYHVARRIAACGQLIVTKVQQKLIAAPCQRRECLRCVAQRLYPKYRRCIALGVRQMVNPISIRFSVASFGEDDLEKAINLLRSSLSKVRRLRSMRGVSKGIGMLHPDHAKNERWHPHFHVLMDVPADFDIEAVDEDWRRLTKGWGWVELRPPDPKKARAENETGDPGDTDQAAGYIAHTDDWAPMYGAMPLSQYECLRRAISGRQLLVSWGLNGRGRKGPESAFEVSGEELVAVCARVSAQAKDRHAMDETVEWDRVEERQDVVVECIFNLVDDGPTGPSRMVRDAFLMGNRTEVVEWACMSFLALGLRADDRGRARLVEIVGLWLGVDLVPVRRASRVRKSGSDQYRVRLSDGPPDARGDCSQLDFVFQAIGHAIVMTGLDDAVDAVELIAALWLAEMLRYEPGDDQRRGLVLASVRRLLGVGPA